MSGSGDHPSDSRGWNHEWFHSSPFPNLDTNFSPHPQTQGSRIPGGYRPYPVDEQDAEGRYGWARETSTGGSAATPLEGSSGVPSRSRSVCVRTRCSTGGDPIVRTPYTPGEMEKLFKAYLVIYEDAETDTNQFGDRFWCASLASTIPPDRMTPSSAMRVWCAIPLEEPTMKSKSSRGITSRNSGRQGAAQARSRSSRPPCRPTNQFSTNYSSISTLGRRCVII